ncbi:MAG: hypothetical protein ACKO86_30630, partial [Dolichospermum sp.]
MWSTIHASQQDVHNSTSGSGARLTHDRRAVAIFSSIEAFDGERIEEIVRSHNKAEIAEAIRIFLGVEVIELSIKHLKEAKKSLETEFKNIGDSETKQ